MKTIILALITFLTSNLVSQTINIHYYSTGAGRNVTASWAKSLNNSELGVGVGYNIGSIKQPDDQNNIFYKRLFPTKPIHYLNLNAYYNYYFFNNSNCVKPMFFFDFQVKYSTTRSSMYKIHKYDSTITANTHEEKILYRNIIEYFGPFLWVENSIGIGFKADITNKLYLKQQIGLGGHFIIGKDDRLPFLTPAFEFYGLISTTFGYRFTKQK